MNTEVHILAFNEAEILIYALRHYRTFCEEIFVHDAGSTDGSQELCARYGAKVLPWDTGGQLDDMMALGLKNSCWSGTKADWVICVDADELMYFPGGANETLETYSRIGAAVIKPFGFEMFSRVYPTTPGQIYDEVKTGSRDDKWYGKPVLFSPHKVRLSGFGLGAHECEPVLHDGRKLRVGANWPRPMPPTFLLHYHHIGPAERLAKRYDEIQARFSQRNRAHGWGVNEPGAIHVQRKRDLILPNLEQVIP